MTLTERDIEYRFGQLPPSAIVADSASAARIEAAERAAGREVRTKIIVGAARTGWINFDDTKDCDDEAEAERTRSDDRLFVFFTSGTTGPPKMVLHTHVSYPVGHLTTAAWIGIKSSDVHYNVSQPGWTKFAWSSFFAPWNVGATTVGYHYLGRFVAREHLDVLQKNQVTTFCAPPNCVENVDS
jgi:acyl-coenzyme A synthetase/AMP-(fatty) acid ligase